MSHIINIEMLPPDAKKKMHKYLKKLIHLHGSNIISIFLYGSAAGRNYVAGASDINIGIIFKELKFADLKKSSGLVGWGIRKRISAPLFLTLKHMQGSSDTFPIEFMEMKDSYILLYGQDLLKDLPLKIFNIRLECEQQLKGKLITIRQAYLERGQKSKYLDLLLKDSLNSLFPVFRAIVQIKTSQSAPTYKEDIINSLSKNFGIDPDVFWAILHGKKYNSKIDANKIGGLFEKYMSEIEKLAIVSDQLRAQ